jgi:Right handed beta helix region
VTGSQIHQIGDNPFTGNQNGRAVFYAKGATGTVSGNDIYDYQKNGMVATGDKTNVQVLNNTVTGRGHLTTIAQNGVVILDKATALIKGNSISGNRYTGASYTAFGLLLIDAAGVKQQANTFLDNQANLGNFGRGGGSTNA